MKQSWVDYFKGLSEQVALKSKDPNSKVGCLIVGIHENILASGFNGFARNVLDDVERYDDRDIKNHLIVHAEANAVAAAARAGVSLFPSTAFVTHPPCVQCAALLIQSGVMKIYCPPINEDSKWSNLQHMAVEMCKEAKVRVEFYDED